ncbi:MAG: c-type cytochrome [Alphaproteobacteria bacterium]|nr:c-type cytochrome [Alphaproteobacteria bacterium]
MRILAGLAAGLAVAGWMVGAAAQDDAMIAKGEYIARASNCVACHSIPGGPAFAGGLKMATPLGAIYATNITPDTETGIGSYTLDDFDRAVREGVAKQGHRLYPAMPYPSYAKLSTDDIAAMYAYFMKAVPAVKLANKPSEIPSPWNMRWPLAIWNLLFVDFDRYETVDGKDEAWNRGAYLVQGAGHCGACHTPRSIAWNEVALDDSDTAYLAGAPLDYWSAPSLRQDKPAGLGQWSVEDIAAYLKTGHNKFGGAYGTMVEVVNNSTQFMTDADLNGMATYLKSLPAARSATSDHVYSDATTAALKKRPPEGVGALSYLQYCEACHVDTGMGYGTWLAPLAGNTSLMDPDPSSSINIILNGSARIVVAGMPDSYRMPPFRGLLTDVQVAELATFIRSGWGNNAPAVTAAQVAEIRANTRPASDRVEVLKMK